MKIVCVRTAGCQDESENKGLPLQTLGKNLPMSVGGGLSLALPIPPAGGSQPGTGSPTLVLPQGMGERECEGKPQKGHLLTPHEHSLNSKACLFCSRS